MSNNIPAQEKTRLISHFDDHGYTTRTTQSAGWTSLWESDQSDLWDRGKPSPALVDFLSTHPDAQKLGINNGEGNNGRRLKALVPGCGRGHDVTMLALHGFEAWGLEISQKAVDTAKRTSEAELASPSEKNFAEAAKEKKPSGGGAHFIIGDFFKRDWESQCASGEEGFEGFDLIYDYTFLCALLPSMRKDWAQRMSQLVAATGILICLEFPMWKDLRLQGPPWGLNGVHWNLLAEGGDGTIDDESGSLKQVEEGGWKFERLVYWKPPVSFEQSRGMDMLSVWKLK